MLLVPEIPEVTQPTFEAWQAQIADLHLGEPSRILRLAAAAGVLPEHVVIVGCQPERCEEFEEGLSRHVTAAVAVAARRVEELVQELLVELPGASPS